MRHRPDEAPARTAHDAAHAAPAKRSSTEPPVARERPGSHGERPSLHGERTSSHGERASSHDERTGPHGEPASSYTERPSKTRRKRDMLELQALGESLLPLADQKLEQLPISDALRDAIRFARGMNSREGRRRQLQYVGRLMRDVDADALRDALSVETREQRSANALMHAAERWRERLVCDDRAMRDWCENHPGTRGDVEALLPRARVELAGAGPGRAYRELYRRLRDALAAANAEPTERGNEPK